MELEVKKNNKKIVQKKGSQMKLHVNEGKGKFVDVV